MRRQVGRPAGRGARPPPRLTQGRPGKRECGSALGRTAGRRRLLRRAENCQLRGRSGGQRGLPSGPMCSGRTGSLLNRRAILKQVRRNKTVRTPEGTHKRHPFQPSFPLSRLHSTLGPGVRTGAVVLPGLRQPGSLTPTLAGKWGWRRDSDPQHGVAEKEGLSEETEARPPSQATFCASWGSEGKALQDS